MTPGPIAINSSTFVGIRVAGIPGAIIATIGCVIPSCIIVLFLAFIYYKYRNLSVVKGVLNGLRPAVTAMIASAGFSLVILAFWNGSSISTKLADLDVTAVILFAISLVILRKWKANPIYVMIGAGIIGLAVYSFIV